METVAHFDLQTAFSCTEMQKAIMCTMTEHSFSLCKWTGSNDRVSWDLKPWDVCLTVVLLQLRRTSQCGALSAKAGGWDQDSQRNRAFLSFPCYLPTGQDLHQGNDSMCMHAIFLLGDPSNPSLWDSPSSWWHVLCQVLVMSSAIHYVRGFQTVCQPSCGNKQVPVDLRRSKVFSFCVMAW